MRIEPTAATTIVATVLAPIGSPAAFRMAGLTMMMYAIATNVEVPPRMSFRMVFHPHPALRRRISGHTGRIDAESQRVRYNNATPQEILRLRGLTSVTAPE